TAVIGIYRGWAKSTKPKATKPKPGEAVAAETGSLAQPEPVAKRRVVKIGYVDGDRVEIRDGLKPGERVITLGRDAVRDGSEVQVLPPSASNSNTNTSAAE